MLSENLGSREYSLNSDDFLISRTDLTGKITYANPAFCQMVGFSEEELISARPPMPYWPPEEMERIQLLNDALFNGELWRHIQPVQNHIDAIT